MSTVDPVQPADTTESTTLRCARHPNTETVLRCGRCETPICPRCLVSTPVGARCPTCAQVKRFATALKPRELVAATALGIGASAAGSILFGFIPFLGPLISLAIVGFVVGELVSVGANRKRSPELGPLAIVCLVLGYCLAPVLGAMLVGRLDIVLSAPIVVVRTLLIVLSQPLVLVGLGVGALLAWMRVR